MPERLRVSVAYADPERQVVRELELAQGATVDEAIRASGILDRLPRGFAPDALGIFGRIVGADTVLRDGDRIELYRPLKVDPMQARRRRAGNQP